MNRLAALALLLLVSVARALGPVSIETNWNWQTVGITTSTVTGFTFDVGGFGAAGYAIVGGTYVANGSNGTTWGALLPISSATANVTGFSYTVLPIGGNATFTIAQTLKTPPPKGSVASAAAFNNQAPQSMYFTAPVISTSSAITVPNGTPYSASFEARVVNPVFIFSSLSSATSVYLSVNYGTPAIQ